MAPKHIAFLLEPAYGHIVPTLALASELMRRKHSVSYAVTREFAPAIIRSGAQAVVFSPIETRTQLCKYTARADGSYDFDAQDVQLKRLASEFTMQRRADSLRQLERLYAQNKPDLVVHDGSGAEELANKWKLTKVRYLPDMWTLANQPKDQLESPDVPLTLVPVPKFFSINAALPSERIRFIGFSPEGRQEFFEPWQHDDLDQKIILACPTTGLLPPVQFCKLIVEAFGRSSWSVVLSVSGDRDPISAIGTEFLADLPANIRLNRHSSNLDPLKHAGLFVGQGGQGSTLEAIFSGVPALLLPVSQFHDSVAQRVVELGLGARLPIAIATPESLRHLSESLIVDVATLTRVKRAQEAMRADNGAIEGANLVEESMR